MRAQGYSCKNLVRNIKILKETCKMKTIPTTSCKISAKIMHSLARHLASISFFSQLEYATFVIARAVLTKGKWSQLLLLSLPTNNVIGKFLRLINMAAYDNMQYYSNMKKYEFLHRREYFRHFFAKNVFNRTQRRIAHFLKTWMAQLIPFYMAFLTHCPSRACMNILYAAWMCEVKTFFEKKTL